MPTATKKKDTPVEDLATAFIEGGWSALRVAAISGPEMSEKQLQCLRMEVKQRSSKGLSDSEIRVIQRLISGLGTGSKEDAASMIVRLGKQPETRDPAERIQVDTNYKPKQARDLAATQQQVSDMLADLRQAKEVALNLAVIAAPADPDVCVYCDRLDGDDHKDAKHEFEPPEGEAVIAYVASQRVEDMTVALRGFIDELTAEQP